MKSASVCLKKKWKPFFISSVRLVLGSMARCYKEKFKKMLRGVTFMRSKWNCLFAKDSTSHHSNIQVFRRHSIS